MAVREAGYDVGSGQLGENAAALTPSVTVAEARAGAARTLNASPPR